MERIAKLGPPIYILYRSACLIQNYHHRHVECKWQLCAKMLIVKYQHLHRVVLSGNERCESDGVDVSASISEEPPQYTLVFFTQPFLIYTIVYIPSKCAMQPGQAVLKSARRCLKNKCSESFASCVEYCIKEETPKDVT